LRIKLVFERSATCSSVFSGGAKVILLQIGLFRRVKNAYISEKKTIWVSMGNNAHFVPNMCIHFS
jgi:hypothetical protein